MQRKDALDADPAGALPHRKGRSQAHSAFACDHVALEDLERLAAGEGVGRGGWCVDADDDHGRDLARVDELGECAVDVPFHAEGGGVDIVDQQPEAWADAVAAFIKA